MKSLHGGLLALTLALGLAGFDSLVARLVWPALIGWEWTLELPVAATAAAWALRRRRAAEGTAQPSRIDPWPLAWAVLLTAGLIVAVWAAVSSLVQTFQAHPHGAVSDAWVIWNQKARFRYRGGAHAWLVFDPQLVHSRYPLLLPGLIARLWEALGSDTPRVPQGLGLSFFGLVLGILVTTLHRLRGWTTACVSGLSLLSLPFFIENAAYQGADLPLSLFVLASLSCLAISTERPDAERGALVLAGAFAGFAAWTKVEGLLLPLGLLGAAALSRGVPRDRLRRGALLLAGSAPLVAALLVVNTVYLKTPSEYAHQAPSVMLDRILTLGRHRLILSEAGRFAFAEGQREALVLLALAARAWRYARRGSTGGTQAFVLVVLCVVSAGFYAVYLITPYALDWQVPTSINRLFIQYWPALVLLAFLGGPPIHAAPESG
jgi:hypothetical protein